MAEMGYVAGYLAMSIPMISHMLVNQGGMMMANLAGGVMTGMQGVAQRGAEEATTGNISFGQVQQDNINMHKNDQNVSRLNGLYTYQGEDGNQFTSSSYGTKMDNNPVTADIKDGLQASVKTSLENSLTAAKQDSKVYIDSAGQSLDRLNNVNDIISNAARQGHTFDSDTRSNWEQASGKAMELAEQFQQSTGIASNDMAKLAASAHTGFDFLGSGVKVSIGGEMQELTEEKYNEAMSWIEKNNVTDTLKEAQVYGEKIVTDYAGSHDDIYAKSTAASFQEATRAENNAMASLSKAQAWKHTDENLRSQGAGASIAASEEFRDYLAEVRGAGEADDLLARIRNGDSNARLQVQMHIADWAKDTAEGMMHDNLKQSEVLQTDASNKAGINGLEAIKQQFELSNEQVTQLIKATGQATPDLNDPHVQKVINEIKATQAKVEAAKSGAEVQGAVLIEQVKARQDETPAEAAARRGKEILPGGSNSSPLGDNKAGVKGAGQSAYDQHLENLGKGRL